MKKIWLEPGCTTCGACEFIEPEVFEVTDVCHIRKQTGAITPEKAEKIKQAAQACPVNVIKYEE